MTKQTEVFLQTRPTTCGVACLMMAAHRILGTPELTSAVEGKIRKRLKLSGWDLVPMISLAAYAKEMGLTVDVRHDEPGKFWAFVRTIEDPRFGEQLERRYAIASRLGVRPKAGPIEPAEIFARLDGGELLVVGVLCGAERHAVLLLSREGTRVSLADPLHGLREMELDRLLDFGRMDTGSWYVAIRKQKIQQ